MHSNRHSLGGRQNTCDIIAKLSGRIAKGRGTIELDWSGRIAVLTLLIISFSTIFFLLWGDQRDFSIPRTKCRESHTVINIPDSDRLAFLI